MGKFVFGFFIGATTISLAFVFFSARQDAGTVDIASLQSVEADSDSPAIKENNGDQNPAPIEAEERDTRRVRSVEYDESREIRLNRELEEAQRTANEIAMELEELRVAKKLAEEPIVFPLPLSDELTWVLDDPTVQLTHGTIQREYRDEVWAGPTEQQLHKFFADRPGIVERFGFPTITCRTTICEVSLVGYGADERFESVAFRAYGDLILEMRGHFNLVPDENSPGHLPEAHWLGQRFEDGVGTLFWSLPRKD